MSEKNKAVVDRITRVFNEGNLAVLDDLVSPDFTGHSPFAPREIHGPEGLKSFFGILRDALPDIHHPSWFLIGEGDFVVIHMPLEGTFENQLMGIPANGKKIYLWMANIWKVVDGRAVEWWINLDTLSLMQQLGAVPYSGQA